jgi:hypothetical protein
MRPWDPTAFSPMVRILFACFRKPFLAHLKCQMRFPWRSLMQA